MDIVKYCSALFLLSGLVFQNRLTDIHFLPPPGRRAVIRPVFIKSDNLIIYYLGKANHMKGSGTVFIMKKDFPYNCFLLKIGIHRVKHRTINANVVATEFWYSRIFFKPRTSALPAVKSVGV